MMSRYYSQFSLGMQLCGPADRIFTFAVERKDRNDAQRTLDASEAGKGSSQTAHHRLRRGAEAGTTAIGAAARIPSLRTDTSKGAVEFPSGWLQMLAEELRVAGAFGIFGAGVEGFDDGGDAAARAEVAGDFGPDGVAGFDYVVEDLVDDVLLEDA